jgi:hypothetical protein
MTPIARAFFEPDAMDFTGPATVSKRLINSLCNVGQRALSEQ